MCQENKKHKSGTASDSLLKTKRGNIISGPLVTVIPCCAPPSFTATSLHSDILAQMAPLQRST